MLEKYKNKDVKVLISSNSGVGVSTEATANKVVSTSMIICKGKLNDYDDNFIELTNVQILRNNLVEDFWGMDIMKPRLEESKSTIISRNNIISISLIDE